MQPGACGNLYNDQSTKFNYNYVYIIIIQYNMIIITIATYNNNIAMCNE